MAYRFVSFAGVALPLYNTQVDWTGGVATSTLVETINDAYDTRGELRAVPRKAVYTLRGLVLSGDDTALEQVNALRGLIGVVGTLVREPRGGGDDQATTARLLSVNLTSGRTPRVYEELNLVFEAPSPYWRGQSRNASRSGGTIAASNAGNAPVRDGVLTVTGAITSGGATVTGAGIDWSWDGTLAAGQTLVVSGNTVTANGQPTTVSLNEGQLRDVLIELEPGANSLTVTGGASAALAWYDAWQ